MAGRFGAVVVGAGPGGRQAARLLIGAGLSVAVVEAELVGGECPFWACIPSKTLLRAGEARVAARRVAGLSTPDIDWGEVSAYRDYMNSGLDDTKKAKALTDSGVELVRGSARLAGPGSVEVDDRVLECERIVIATGSESATPDLSGLGEVDFWTNREATALHEVPASALVLGGGPVGVELAQMLSRFGSDVTIVEPGRGLLPREDPEVGALLAELLDQEGIAVRVGTAPSEVRRAGDGVEVVVGDETLAAERLVLAAGRSPRLDGLGIDAVGARAGSRGVEIDESCRAAEGVWAIGDVTGVAPFTHVANYQARIACADILGERRPADYRAVPRVVFSDPEVAAVGLTEAGAREQGIDAATATIDLAAVDRTETYGKDLHGFVRVIADARRRTVVGAAAVGPVAGEWIHAAAVAVKAEVPLAVLGDSLAQFPTFSEAFLDAARELADG